MPEPTMNEERAASELGVSKDDLAVLRRDHLYEGEHWRRKGKAIVYLEAGVAKAKGAIMAAVGMAPSPLEKNGAPAAPVTLAPPLEGDLTVVRWGRNSRVVLCQDPEGKTCRLVARDTTGFKRGQKVKARHVHDDVWTVVGMIPRRKGVRR